MATPVALQAPCIVIYSGILSAGNSSIGTLFSNQGVGQIWVATMGHFSVAISTGGSSLVEKRKMTAEAFNEANSYFHERRIFLPEEIAEKVDSVFETMRDAFMEFDSAQRGNEEYKPDETGLWIEAYNKVRDKLPQLMKDMEKQFRIEIGAIDNNL